MQSRLMGRVKWFNQNKGYGFIACDRGPDVFIHFADILGRGYRTLQEDETVEFELVEEDGGFKAAKLIKV
ncbi:MAG: cold shock domain-containing protein [Candidatus Glassbacteria bacterium]|nr:cold shock domain-containing protein [Candidatus Glassbacteria bacterium]